VIDKSNNHMYCENNDFNNVNIISKININGEGSINTLEWCIITSLGMVIDNSNTNMYTVNFNNNSVTQINLSSGTINNIFFTSLTYPPFFLTLDVSNTYMYVNLYDNTIIQIDMTNASINAIINTGANPGGPPNCGGVSILGNLLYNVISYNTSNNNVIQTFPLAPIPYVPTVPCFLHNSKILTDKGYIPIQNLRNGDLIKTLKDGYKPIFMIGKRDMNHPCSVERIKSQLYKCTKEFYPELTEDLIITGCHSILVDNFINEDQIEKTKEINIGKIFITDNKYRLPACVDKKTIVYEKPGKYTVYHIALEHNDYYMNYGIYANGLLVESCSKRYLKEKSDMIVIE
jgi:hypothetical protein